MRDAAVALLTPFTKIDLLERVKVRKLLRVVHGQLAIEDAGKDRPCLDATLGALATQLSRHFVCMTKMETNAVVELEYSPGSDRIKKKDHSHVRENDADTPGGANRHAS